MTSLRPAQVSASRSGLMDLLAGGHVDEITFRQAIELLRAEDWEALRLLLAGVPGSQSYTVPPRAESCVQRQSLNPHTETPQDAVQKELSKSKKVRHTEQQAANKKPKLSSEPSRRPAFLATSKQPAESKRNTGSQTQGKGRQVGDYDRPWRAHMKTGGSNKGSEQQQKQAEPSLLADNAVAPATRAKTKAWMSQHRRKIEGQIRDEKERQLEPIQRRYMVRQKAAEHEIVQTRTSGPAPLRDGLRPEWAGAPPPPPQAFHADRAALAATILARQLESQQIRGVAQPAQLMLEQSPVRSAGRAPDGLDPHAAAKQASPAASMLCRINAETSTEVMWQPDEQLTSSAAQHDEPSQDQQPQSQLEAHLQLYQGLGSVHKEDEEAQQRSPPDTAAVAAPLLYTVWRQGESEDSQERSLADGRQFQSELPTVYGAPVNNEQLSSPSSFPVIHRPAPDPAQPRPVANSVQQQTCEVSKPARGSPDLLTEPRHRRQLTAEKRQPSIAHDSPLASSLQHDAMAPQVQINQRLHDSWAVEQCVSGRSTLLRTNHLPAPRADNAVFSPSFALNRQMPLSTPAHSQGRHDSDAWRGTQQANIKARIWSRQQLECEDSSKAKADTSSSHQRMDLEGFAGPGQPVSQGPHCESHQESMPAGARVDRRHPEQENRATEGTLSSGMYPVTLMLPPGASRSFTVTAPFNKQYDMHSRQILRSQRVLVVDDRVERQRVVMQQLAEMRHSASSLQERVAKLSGDVHPRMLGQWRSHPSSPVKYLHGSPTGSDRTTHPPAHPRHAPGSPAFPVPHPFNHPHHPRVSPDQPDHTPSRGRLQLQDHGTSPYESPDVRRVLALSLVDRACSPMPDLPQQLPLPEILAAVRQQLLEPWAAQQLLHAQVQGDAMSHLQALPEAVSEPELESDEASLTAIEQRQSAAFGPAGTADSQSLMTEKHASDMISGISQMQAPNDAQLDQMNSTADLENTSEEAELNAFTSRHTSPDLPSDHHNHVSREVSKPAEHHQSPAVEQEAEETLQEFALQQSLSDPSHRSSARSAEADSAASSDSNNPLQQQSWHEQWQELQHQQQQRQQRRAWPQAAQPNELMTKVAAASIAEQSLPMRGTFERHTKQIALTESQQRLHGAAVNEMTGASGIAFYLPEEGSHGLPGLQAVAELFAAQAAESAHGQVQHSWPDDSSDNDEAEDVCAVQDLPDEIEAKLGDLSKEDDTMTKGSGNDDRLGGPTWGASSVSKRSLAPASAVSANESSGDTSPEAARNSRMKVRRTSGEYQQGVFKQLQAFNDEPRSSTSHIPELHQVDPLNIINVALARQKAAVQAGCSDRACADSSSNLVNTLYRRQQALFVHQQQQQQQQQLQRPDQSAQSSQAEVQASTNIHTAEVADNDAHADAEFPNSPKSFEGDTILDTPVNGAAPLEAALAGDHSLDSRGHQEADEAAADAEGIELVFDQVSFRQDTPNQGAPGEPAVPASTGKPSAGQQGNEGLDDEQLQVQNADPARQHAQAVSENRELPLTLPLSPDTMQRAFQNELRRLEGIEHAEHELNMLQQAHAIATAQQEMARLGAADHREAIAQHEQRLQQMHDAQEARLQQLSMDLRSELSSGSLSQLKGMISDFMQQLKDSVSRQGQIQTAADESLDSYPEPLRQMGNLAARASSSSTQAVMAGPQAQRYHVSKQRGRGAVPEASALLQGAAQSQQQTAAQSVTTEDEIELDLPESRASSVIEEEAGLASRAAESVAESVSDFQYSMDFEGSMPRSPMSGFRSPVPGIALHGRSHAHTPGAESAASHMLERAAAIEAAALEVAAQLAEKQRELNRRRREAALAAKAALVEQMKASIAEIDSEIQALKAASEQSADSLTLTHPQPSAPLPLPGDHQLTPSTANQSSLEQQAILALTGSSKAPTNTADVAALAAAANGSSQNKPFLQAVAITQKSLLGPALDQQQQMQPSAETDMAVAEAAAVSRQLSQNCADEASEPESMPEEVDSASETIEEDLEQGSQLSSTSASASASSLGHQLSDQDQLPDQAGFQSRAGSTISTPRSLRPGTVPRLDLSPAIAIHTATSDDPNPDNAAGQEEDGENLASEQQAAAMASFDDLSGPEASDKDSDTASQLSDRRNELPQGKDEVDLTDDRHLTDDGSTASAAPSDLDHALQAASASVSLLSETASKEYEGHENMMFKARSSAHADSAAVQHTGQMGNAGQLLADATPNDVHPQQHESADALSDITHHTQSGAPAGKLSHGMSRSVGDSASTASSVSEDPDLDSDVLSQEPSPRSGTVTQTDTEGGALHAHVVAGTPNAGHVLLTQDLRQLSGSSGEATDSAQVSIANPTTAVDEEDQHLAPDLLAYAEAALADSQAEAEMSPPLMGAGAAQAAAKDSHTQAPETELTLRQSHAHQLVASRMMNSASVSEHAAPFSVLSDPASASLPSESGMRQIPSLERKPVPDQLPSPSNPDLAEQQVGRHATDQVADDIAAKLFDELLSNAIQIMTGAGLQVSIPAIVEHQVESGGNSPEVDLLSNESFSWHPSSHSEEEEYDEVYGVDDRPGPASDPFSHHPPPKAQGPLQEQIQRQQHTASTADAGLQAMTSVAEDICMTVEEAISTGPEAVMEYTSQLLAVMQEQAEARGSVATLDLDDYLEVARAGLALSDEQHIYNKLIFDAVNEAITECIVDVWQRQSPPFLQQRRPLRQLPTTPAEVAQVVQQKVLAMCRLSQHGQGDMQDIQNLMSAALLSTEKVDAKCVTWQEANMKMELANLIFDDLIEDTALAFCDAHNMPIVATV